MMPFKSILVTILTIFCMPSLVIADDGNTMYYYSKSSMIPTLFFLDDLDKITFNDSGIQMYKMSGMNEISFSDFLLFTFKEIEHPYITVIEPLSLSQDVSIRYEPSSRSLQIESNRILNGSNVYDLQGRVVAVVVSASSSYQISLSSAPKGVYFVKVVCGGKTIVKKIVL